MTRRTPDFIDEQQKTKRARTTTVSTDSLPDEKDANTSSLAGDDDNAVDVSEDPLGYATDSGSELSEPEDDFEDVQEQQSAQNTAPHTEKPPKLYTTFGARKVDESRLGFCKEWLSKRDWLECDCPTSEVRQQVGRKLNVVSFVLASEEALWFCVPCSTPALRGALKPPSDKLSTTWYPHTSATRPDKITKHENDAEHKVIMAYINPLRTSVSSAQPRAWSPSMSCWGQSL